MSETTAVRVSDALPLAGRCVAVTRPREQAADLVSRLEALGAEAVTCPTIAIVPPESWDALDLAVRDVARTDRYDWIAFTSANAVDAFAERRLRWLAADAAATQTIAPRIAVVGPATARAASVRLRAPDVVSRVHLAEALADELEDVRGKRVLFPCADGAREALPDVLRSRGATVDRVTAYRTVPGEGVAALSERVQRGAVDAVLFTSPSCARYFVDGVRRFGAIPAELLSSDRRPALICLGPVTADAARASGLPVDAVAAEHSTDGLIGVVMEWFSAANGRR